MKGLHGFRDERLAKIARGDTLLGSFVTPKIVVHLVPLSSLGQVVSRDVTRDAARLQNLLPPIKGMSWGGRYNFDGFLVFASQTESYVQVFRSGAIEAAALPFMGVPEQYKNQIPSVDFEQTIIVRMDNYLQVQNRLAIPPPIFASIALLQVKGYRMSSYAHSDQRGAPIDRDNLLLPEILIEDYGSNVATLLRPAFDALWQACGQEKSPNYDDEGNRRLDVGR